MIVKNTANNPIKTAITPVVPQPGVTFPYSVFNDFNKFPKGVTIPVVFSIDVDVFVAITYLKLKIK